MKIRAKKSVINPLWDLLIKTLLYGILSIRMVTESISKIEKGIFTVGHRIYFKTKKLNHLRIVLCAWDTLFLSDEGLLCVHQHHLPLTTFLLSLNILICFHSCLLCFYRQLCRKDKGKHKVLCHLFSVMYSNCYEMCFKNEYIVNVKVCEYV